MKIDGRCYCGWISYVAEADPGRAHICHCTDCQTLTGTAYRAGIVVDADSFKVTGEPSVFTKVGDSGKHRIHAFCPNCAAPIYSASPDYSTISLRLGLVTQRANLPPQMQLFCRSALPWASDLAGIRKFDAMPP